MRLITPADDEFYVLASSAARLGRLDKLLARLRRDGRSDPRAAGWYALALMAALPTAGARFQAHARFLEAIEALGEVLAGQPGHWLARYSRARLWAMLPGGYGTQPGPAGRPELAGAAGELADLIGRQAAVPAQPYFASAYALALLVNEQSGPGAAGAPAELRAGLAGCPRVPARLPALGAVLCEPLVALHSTGTGAERELAGSYLSTVYGDQPAAGAVLCHQPLR